MCLYSKVKKPLIAQEDIECVKTVSFDKNYHFYTPYQKTDITDSILETKVLKPSFASVIKERVSSWFNVNWNRENRFLIVKGGYIHSNTLGYLTHELTYARGCCFWLNIPCIIPKGSKYYIGNNNDYASDKIIIKADNEDIIRMIDGYEDFRDKQRSLYFSNNTRDDRGKFKKKKKKRKKSKNKKKK